MAWTYTISELANFCGAKVAGAGEAHFSCISTDTRTLERGDVFFALSGENFDGNRFVEEAFSKGAVAAVCTQESDAGPCLLVNDPLVALQDFARSHRERFEIPVIAITGSCGKTTSKDLIAAVLQTRYNVVKTKGNLNNEIGLPLSLLEIDGDTEAAVMEMGANHGGEIADLCAIAKPTEAAITMIAEAHLEGFGTLDDVAKAKGEIVAALPESGLFYMNADDARCVRIAEGFFGRTISFGATGDVALDSCEFNDAGEMVTRVRPVGELVLPLHARAHVTNVLLAIAVGLQHGVTSFQEPLRGACLELSRIKVLRIGPLEIVDDTYNANPASVKAALDALRERPFRGARMAALGDMLELGAAAEELHEAVGAYAGECGVKRLFIRGTHAAATARGARASGVKDVQVLGTQEDIAEAVFACAAPGDAILVKGSRGMRMENVIEHLRLLHDDAAHLGTASKQVQGT